MPQRANELSLTERLQPLRARAMASDEVAISRTVLEELYDRLNDAVGAVGAVEKLNTRIAVNTRFWACTDAIFKTGKAVSECAPAKTPYSSAPGGKRK